MRPWTPWSAPTSTPTSSRVRRFWAELVAPAVQRWAGVLPALVQGHAVQQAHHSAMSLMQEHHHVLLFVSTPELVFFTSVGWRCVGTLPPEYANLTGLVDLDLHDNLITLLTLTVLSLMRAASCAAQGVMCMRRHAAAGILQPDGAGRPGPARQPSYSSHSRCAVPDASRVMHAQARCRRSTPT